MNPLTEFLNLNQVETPDYLILAAGEKDPIFFAEEILGLHLNPFQKRSLLALTFHKQILEETGNQVGKTVELAIDHIWFNFYKKGFSGEPELIERARYETLNISPVSRQSKECFRYAEEILNSRFSWEEDGKRYINNCKISWFFEGKNETLGRIDFSNNSSFFCLSTGEDKASGLAGKQFALITYDECVQSLHLQEELPARIFSRTAKYSGTIKLISSPDELAPSQQYWFHLCSTASKEREEGKEPEWYLIQGTYDENIFIPEKNRIEYKERLKKLDPLKYKQVILGQFIASAQRMFSPEMIEGLWNGKKEKSPPVPGREYVFVWDWGVSEQGDETVSLGADVTDPENAEIVYAYSKQGGDPVEMMAMASFLKLEYNDAKVILPAGGMGDEIFRRMLERLKPISFAKENKSNALFFLQLRLRNNIRKDLTVSNESAIGRVKSYYLPKLEAQLSSYKLEDKKIKQDWVMALAMLMWYLEKYKKTSQMKAFPLKLYE